MKKRLLAWLLLMAMLLTVGAVAAAETNPNAGLGYYPGTSEKGWISVECSTMSKMNPFLQTYSTEFSINRHIWDCLVKLSPEDNSIVPAAAESWESSEDGMNWTFHIRKGMKWVNSKGEVIGDVTANDFVFAWRQLLTITLPAWTARPRSRSRTSASRRRTTTRSSASWRTTCRTSCSM